jgi:hypothetical protein
MRLYGPNYSCNAVDDGERTVSPIRHADTGAILQECRELAERIKGRLSGSSPQRFEDALAAGELQALLEQAAAALKKL